MMPVLPPTSFIILVNALYFGWLLSFPYYGPVLQNTAPFWEYHGFSLVLYFTSFHALSFLLGALILKNTDYWKKLMLGSLVGTLAVYLVLLLPFNWAWPAAMAWMGVCAAFYILGWSYPYSLYAHRGNLLKIMAAIMICSNLVFILFNLLAKILSPQILLAATMVPLIGALVVLLRYPFRPPPALILVQPKRIPLNRALLVVFCLFVFGLYLNGGFMYNIILPALTTDFPFYSYLLYFTYVLVLLAMYLFGYRLHRYFSAYMGVSLLGLTFVSFALLNQLTAGSLLTAALMESAFALLDLFVWVFLGILAFIFKAPFFLFGITLAIMLGSIIFGNLVADQLYYIGETYRLVTASFAAAAIFLVYMVVPYLNKQMDKNLHLVLKKEDPKAQASSFQRLKKHLLPAQVLTPRESEIVMLVLQGLTNQEMATHLFISKNTLKTHLRNIYPKFGVTQKRKLLSMAAEDDEEISEYTQFNSYWRS